MFNLKFFCVDFAAIFEFTPYSKTYLLIFLCLLWEKNAKNIFCDFCFQWRHTTINKKKRETCERKQIQIQFNLFIYFDCPSVRLSVCLLRLFFFKMLWLKFVDFYVAGLPIFHTLESEKCSLKRWQTCWVWSINMSASAWNDPIWCGTLRLKGLTKFRYSVVCNEN